MGCRVPLLSAPCDATPGGEAAAERTAAGGGGATSGRGEPEPDTWLGHWIEVDSTSQDLLRDSLYGWDSSSLSDSL